MTDHFFFFGTFPLSVYSVIFQLRKYVGVIFCLLVFSLNSSNLARRNPVTISRWVLLWAIVGVVCGLFAAFYWLVLEWLTHGLEVFTGPSLLIVMPLVRSIKSWYFTQLT